MRSKYNDEAYKGIFAYASKHTSTSTVKMGSIENMNEHTRYQDVAETSAELDWADLITIDLSKFDRPAGKEELAKQLKTAISTVGFFYVVNFGISQEEVDQQFALGREFYDLPLEEKLKYHNLDDLRRGEYVSRLSKLSFSGFQ